MKIRCYHCDKPFEIAFTPEPEVGGVVCEACELDYLKDRGMEEYFGCDGTDNCGCAGCTRDRAAGRW